MNKYQTYARSRMPGRDERHGAARRSGGNLGAARQVARQFVAERWPALAEVEPEVTLRHLGQQPSSELLARLGIHDSDLGRQRTSTVYTFTFTSQCGTADGARAPLVAAVTIDAQRRVVKTSLSK